MRKKATWVLMGVAVEEEGHAWVLMGVVEEEGHVGVVVEQEGHVGVVDEEGGRPPHVELEGDLGLRVPHTHPSRIPESNAESSLALFPFYVCSCSEIEEKFQVKL